MQQWTRSLTPLLSDHPGHHDLWVRTRYYHRHIITLTPSRPDPEKGARVTSLDDYKKCLDYFQSKGYNEIDTARVYVGGKCEGWTKDAGWKERGLSIATKWYPNEAKAHTGEKIEEKLNESLTELGTDCVDSKFEHEFFYRCHINA